MQVRKDLYQSYKDFCDKKKLHCESFDEWNKKFYPIKSSKAINGKVLRALNQQDHISRELRDNYFKPKV